MKGTTTVGLTFEGGVVLATREKGDDGLTWSQARKQRRYNKIADRNRYDDAGGVGDAQQLARIITV